MDGFTAFLLNGKTAPGVIEFVVRCYGDTRTEMEAKALEEAHRWNEDDDCSVEVHPAYEVWEVTEETNGAGHYWASITILISDGDLDDPIVTTEEAGWPNNINHRMPIINTEEMTKDSATNATQKFYGRYA